MINMGMQLQPHYNHTTTTPRAAPTPPDTLRGGEGRGTGGGDRGRGSGGVAGFALIWLAF